MRYIAVLITVYNRKTKTLYCLKRLFDQEMPKDIELHVYLTNDGCTDGTPEAVREQFPKVHIIDGDGTLFWNRGMWTAWEEARKGIQPSSFNCQPSTFNCQHSTFNCQPYDWYLWLNDDTELLPNAINELTAASKRCDNQPNIIVGATKASTNNTLTYGGRVGRAIPPCDGITHKIDYFNGNIVLVSKQAYDILGNLDFYYTHSRGDYDYGIRAKKAGVIMLQCGNILGICDKHESIDKWCDPDIPFIQRWSMMYKPNGMPPNEIFHLEKKQFGFFTASCHWLTVHIRCIIPRLWIK